MAQAVQQRPAATGNNNEALVGWLMGSPAIILLLIFLIIPFLMAFGLSFTNQRLISPNPTEFVGGRNFGRLLTIRPLKLEPQRDASGALVLGDDGQPSYPTVRSFTRNNPAYPELAGLQEWFSFQSGADRWVILSGDAVFMKALINTLYFAVIVVPLQGGLGLLLALLINQRTRGINIYRTIFFMPVVVSMVVVSILWRLIYDGQNGLLNTILGGLTFGGFKPVDWLGNTATAMPAVIAMSVWQGVGFHMVIWLSGLQTIPSSLYEAASLDGANTWQQFRYVTWPGLRNTTVFVLVTITMAAFGLFTQIDVMTNGGPLDSTTTVIHQAVQRGFVKQDIAYGSAISVVFFILVLSVAMIQRYLTREREA